MVILVSFERYLAVCQGTELTIPKAKFYIGVVTIVSVLVNIPSMLVYKWSDGHTKLTDMACDELFIKYYTHSKVYLSDSQFNWIQCFDLSKGK